MALYKDFQTMNGVITLNMDSFAAVANTSSGLWGFGGNGCYVMITIGDDGTPVTKARDVNKDGTFSFGERNWMDAVSGNSKPINVEISGVSWAYDLVADIINKIQEVKDLGITIKPKEPPAS